MSVIPLDPIVACLKGKEQMIKSHLKIKLLYSWHNSLTLGVYQDAHEYFIQVINSIGKLFSKYKLILKFNFYTDHWHSFKKNYSLNKLRQVINELQLNTISDTIIVSTM